MNRILELGTSQGKVVTVVHRREDLTWREELVDRVV